MAAELGKPVSVNFSELLDAFELASAAEDLGGQTHICLSTGKTYFVSDMLDAEEHVPEDIEESDDHIPLPTRRELDLGTPLVFAFVDQEMPGDSGAVSAIFRRKGAYGRFKDLLCGRNLLDKWHAFEASTTEQTLRIWCQECGIQLSDT